MKTLITLVALIATPAFADTYQIDPATSSVLWKAGKKVGSFHSGDVKVKSGSLETDSKGKIKALNVVVDMKTIANEDLKGSPDFQTKLVTHLSSDDFFKVDKHPEATFALTSIEPAGKYNYKVKGQLTMIGNTKPIEFPAKITLNKGTFTGSAKAEIKRLTWGLQYGSGSIFKSLTADKIINDSFELDLKLNGKK